MSNSDDATPVHLTKKLIIFNGPPRCGKDLAANALCHYMKMNAPWLGAVHEKFSTPLTVGAHALYGVFHSPEYIDINNLKDVPHGDMLGITPRAAYIAMFNFLKSLHGEEVLGLMMEQHLRRKHTVGLHVFSDGGRVGDLFPVIDYAHPRNVLVIEVHAEGLNFDNDIRGYMGTELRDKYKDKITVKRINNTISKDPLDRQIFRSLCIGVAKKFLKLED